MDIVLEMLAYELAAVFAILSLWLILRNNKKSKTTYEMASKTVKTLKRYKDVRIEKLATILAEKYTLDNDSLSLAAIDFQDREQQIYKTLLTIFVEQDGKKLLTISEQLEKAIDAGLDLLPAGTLSSNEAAADNKTLPLSEQIEITAQRLETLMAVFRQESDGRSVKLEISNAELDSKINILYVDFHVDNIAEDDSIILAEKKETSKLFIEEDLNDVVEIDIAENEEETDGFFDDLTIADVSDNAVEVEAHVTEGIMSIDDVDALLSSMNDELQAESVFDSIDLSAIDDEEEIEQQQQKKLDTELVAVIADSAEKISDIPTELEIAADLFQNVEAEPAVETSSEFENEPEIVIESEIEADLELEFEPEPAIEAKTEIESNFEDEQETKTESEINVGSEVKPEVEQAASQNRLSNYFNGDWNNVVPDIYGKAVVQPELENTTNATNNNFIGISEPELPLAQNKMSDYIKGGWNSEVPDIYGKTAIQTELEITNIDDLNDFIAADEAEQPLVQNKMSDYIKGDWVNEVPEIYGKTIVQSDTDIGDLSEVKSETESEVKTGAEPEVTTQLETQANTETETELEVGVEAKSTDDLETEVGSGVDVELESTAKPKDDSEPEIAVQPEITTELEPEIEAKTNSEIEILSKTKEVEAELEIKAELDIENLAITESQFDTEEAMLTAMMTQLDLSEQDQIPANDINIWHEEIGESKTEFDVLSDKLNPANFPAEIENQLKDEPEPEFDSEVDVESVIDKQVEFDIHSPQTPLPDEDTLNELLADVWQLETESKELGLNNTELMTDNIVESEPEPEPEPEPALKQQHVIVDAEYALADMMMDLTAEPVSSEVDFKKTTAEITRLEQKDTMLKQVNKPKIVIPKHDELQSILSNIPSFTEMNKKR